MNFVLAALRSPRNRPYLHAVLSLVLASWIGLLVSATCAMPAVLQAALGMMLACAEQPHHASGHADNGSNPSGDCSFKPCFESQPNPGFVFDPQKAGLPFVALGLAWVMGLWLAAIRPTRIPRGADPPHGKRIPLIYRYCALLN